MTSLAGSTVHFVAKPLFRPAVISDALRTLVERVRSAPEWNARLHRAFAGERSMGVMGLCWASHALSRQSAMPSRVPLISGQVQHIYPPACQLGP
jgi:hypothetical protein